MLNATEFFRHAGEIWESRAVECNQMKFKAAAVQTLTQLPHLAFGASIKSDRFGDPQAAVLCRISGPASSKARS